MDQARAPRGLARDVARILVTNASQPVRCLGARCAALPADDAPIVVGFRRIDPDGAPYVAAPRPETPGGGTLVTTAEHARAVAARRVAEGQRNAENERLSLKVHVYEDPIGDLPLTLVDRASARAWLGRMVTKTSAKTRRPLATQTIRNSLNLLRVIFGAAVDDGVIDANPFADVIVPRAVASRRPAKATTFLTAAELGRVLELAAPIPELSRSIAFAVGSLLRLEEMHLLDRVDVVTEGDRPHLVVRWGSRDKKTGERLPPKNGKTRTVPLFGLALDAARAQLAALDSDGRANPLGLLFPADDGAHRKGTPPGGRKGWERALKLAELGRHVRWHDLRGTGATHLLAGTWGEPWPIATVSKMLGHASIAVTERYARALDDSLFRAAARTGGGS